MHTHTHTTHTHTHTGFLTAVLQTKARKSQVPIDSLSFEFTIINLDEAEITAPPREGVYVKGLYSEVCVYVHVCVFTSVGIYNCLCLLIG